MLAIRMQRIGRHGHAQYRLIVQDSRFSPTSGRVVAFLGSYDPHTKRTTVDGQKATAYLANGAQPSDRVAKLLKNEGIKLPDWVRISPEKKSAIRNPEKLRRNRPAEPAKQKAPAEPAEPAPKVLAEDEASKTAETEQVSANEIEAAAEPEAEAAPEVQEKSAAED